MNILIIEKNRALAQEIATLLRIPHSHGIETSIANSWEEGLECIDAMDEGPNLIIYDGSELRENPTICDSLPDYFKSRLMLFTVNPEDEGLPYPFVQKPDMHTLKLAVKRFFRLDPVPPPQHKPPRVLIAFYSSETVRLVTTIAHGHGFNCTQSDNPLEWLTNHKTRLWDYPAPDIIICSDLVFYNQLPPDLKDKCIFYVEHSDLYRGQLHANCPLLERPEQLHARMKAEMALTPWRIQLTMQGRRDQAAREAKDTVTLTVNEFRALAHIVRQHAICEREDVAGVFMKTGCFHILGDRGQIDLARKVQAQEPVDPEAEVRKKMGKA